MQVSCKRKRVILLGMESTQIEPFSMDAAASFKQGPGPLCILGHKVDSGFPGHVVEKYAVLRRRPLLSTYCMPGYVQSPLRKFSHLFPQQMFGRLNTSRKTHAHHVSASPSHGPNSTEQCPLGMGG